VTGQNSYLLLEKQQIMDYTLLLYFEGQKHVVKLDIDVDINRAWGSIRDNINISAKQSLGYYELKKHKP
jgi:hypothetical protein